MWAGHATIAVVPDVTEYRNAIVRISDLTVLSDVIEDTQFHNCEIVGPVVFVILEDVMISNSGFDSPGPDALFWPVDKSRRQVMGAVGLSRVTFESCQFRRVGLAAQREHIEGMLKGFGSR